MRHPKASRKRYEGLWRSKATSRCETSIARRCRRSCSHRGFRDILPTQSNLLSRDRFRGEMRFCSRPSRGEHRSVLAFSDRGKSSNGVWDANRSRLTFNLPPGNASPSMGPDVRRACAMQLAILVAYPPTPTDSSWPVRHVGESLRLRPLATCVDGTALAGLRLACAGRR